MRLMIGTFNRAVRLMNRIALGVACVSVLALVGIGSADVIGTQVFGRAVPSAIELQEAFEALLIFMPLAWVTEQHGHIAIDTLTCRMPAALRRGAEVLALVAALTLFGLLAANTCTLAVRSIAASELSPGFVSFPLYPFKAAVFLGCLAAALEVARQLLVLAVSKPTARHAEIAAVQSEIF
ncbi:TRAP transporter small permease [Inquilinus sp. OTU3971]|uniref:TRAP transporter small permease n=1 Tax=Inquilinus sp. OTU3971 TaxID=3043855 RepID=UPI00313E83B2